MRPRGRRTDLPGPIRSLGELSSKNRCVDPETTKDGTKYHNVIRVCLIGLQITVFFHGLSAPTFKVEVGNGRRLPRSRDWRDSGSPESISSALSQNVPITLLVLITRVPWALLCRDWKPFVPARGVLHNDNNSSSKKEGGGGSRGVGQGGGSSTRWEVKKE